MKAYEIKVTIKGSKPPIWRKIIIPEGINFMQLHNTIQVAFECLSACRQISKLLYQKSL